MQNGQNPPPNYQDPIYAYNHDQGCAIVGAAVYRAEESSFPDHFEGRLFFSDYCEGYIKSIDTETGQEEVFATGIERPLAILVEPHDGTLFYLARAGLGGGSPGDNTSTREGTLWKVSYTGSGKPFISIPPADQLRVVGETAEFFIKALGSDPLNYQWLVNKQLVQDSNISSYAYENLQLIDHNAEIECIVYNTEGADTSNVAILSVTDNQRPQVQISQPLAGALFSCWRNCIL